MEIDDGPPLGDAPLPSLHGGGSALAYFKAWGNINSIHFGYGARNIVLISVFRAR